MSRFNDNGNDTITDSETNLTWFKKENRLKMIETDKEKIVYEEMIRLMDE